MAEEPQNPIGHQPANNVSPKYGLYDRKSSQTAIDERRQARQDSANPEAALLREVRDLKLDVKSKEQRIKQLEDFDAGMTGDENIKVAGNRITWIGRVKDGLGGDTLEVAINVAGVALHATFVTDGRPPY